MVGKLGTLQGGWMDGWMYLDDDFLGGWYIEWRVDDCDLLFASERQ